jgi:hypothetical protein
MTATMAVTTANRPVDEVMGKILSKLGGSPGAAAGRADPESSVQRVDGLEGLIHEYRRAA